MGKRKERRHAAKTNAGRRFKLDLFAEPSTGDLGGSSVEDEVEVDKEPKKPGAGSPSSPSTSGKPENPLLLLGQYSDEDSEVDSDKKPGDKPTGEASFPGNKDEIGASKGDGQTDDESNTEEVKQHKIDTFIASLDIKQDPENTDTGKENNDTRGSIGDPEQNGDAGSNWQTVMHEESNQYYYWNVVTGETSWVIPEVLAREAEVSANHITPETADSVFPTHNPSLNSVECNGGGTEEDGNNANLSNDHVNYGSADASLDENPVKSDSEKFVDELGIDLLSNCERHCESLLQRLKSVHRPKNESLDCIAKYALEVEIRLSDIKALSAFGSSLHHYWAHSEMQLKRLADSINLEIYKLAQTSLIEDTPREITDLKPETNGTENKDSSPIPKEQTLVISKDQSLASPTNEQNISHHLSPDEDDDVDMDVDMEVEDSSSDDVEKSVAEESSEPIHPAEPPHEMTVPPPLPPDDEWVPPPPPDSDNIPPPLPDDLPVPYVDSYNLSYPDPNFAYYSQAGTRVIATGNFYGQVAEAPIYYSGGIPSTHPEAANHIVPVSYYDFQDGGVPPVPGVSGTEAAQFQGEPTLITYGNLASDSTGSALISAVEAGHTTTIEASPVVVEQESVLLPSTNPVSVVPETKGHTKVARTKKRANAVPTTSRPSKKVSNLVNKWKAAKEELLEEEPQTAYEMLERKRQKEIEEWRAQQIASGEAKANANFQPLGGDWRERVKRRRAQKAKEGAESQTSPEEHKDEESNSQLTELSKGLPTGWKVYFDASSKQVYYGNTVTSETSWTRPTK